MKNLSGFLLESRKGKRYNLDFLKEGVNEIKLRKHESKYRRQSCNSGACEPI